MKVNYLTPRFVFVHSEPVFVKPLSSVCGAVDRTVAVTGSGFHKGTTIPASVTCQFEVHARFEVAKVIVQTLGFMRYVQLRESKSRVAFKQQFEIIYICTNRNGQRPEMWTEASAHTDQNTRLWCKTQFGWTVVYTMICNKLSVDE